MPSYGKVVGRFFTQQEKLGPVPLSGSILFTPRSHAKGDALYAAAPVVARVVDGVLTDGSSDSVSLLAPSEGVEPSAWSWLVEPSLRDPRRGFVAWESFDVTVPAGGTVDLVKAAPVPDPVTGEWVAKGDPGEPGRDALMLAPDPVIRGLFVMVRGAVPVDAAGMIPVGPMLRSER